MEYFECLNGYNGGDDRPELDASERARGGPGGGLSGPGPFVRGEQRHTGHYGTSTRDRISRVKPEDP